MLQFNFKLNNSGCTTKIYGRELKKLSSIKEENKTTIGMRIIDKPYILNQVILVACRPKMFGKGCNFSAFVYEKKTGLVKGFA